MYLNFTFGKILLTVLPLYVDGEWLDQANSIVDPRPYGDNRIIGTAGDDHIHHYGGNDKINGRDGTNIVEFDIDIGHANIEVKRQRILVLVEETPRDGGRIAILTHYLNTRSQIRPPFR